MPLIEFRNDHAQSYVTLKRSGSQQQWKFPDAYGSFPRDVDASGKLVFAGYGITAPELHYDDYAKIDAHGKGLIRTVRGVGYALQAPRS